VGKALEQANTGEIVICCSAFSLLSRSQLQEGFYSCRQLQEGFYCLKLPIILDTSFDNFSKIDWLNKIISNSLIDQIGNG
jgi:hypothetical protein